MIRLALFIIFLFLLPLAGMICSGKETAYLLEFPPVTRYVRHAPFSLPVFIGMGMFVFFAVLPFGVRLFKSFFENHSPQKPVRSLPGWGWSAVVSGLVFWILAWTRFEWFTLFQHHTFTPLWLSYIIAVNGAVYARRRSCLMLRETACFLLLFPASALFWWFFEYLNRFVQNWYYLDVYRFSPMEYFLFASLSFSTVLPAVLSTAELLLTFPVFSEAFTGFRKRPVLLSKRFWGGLLLLAGTGLFLIGPFPNLLYPLLWISPLILLVSFQALSGQNHIFCAAAQGDWRLIVVSATAALVCGLLWEMWNYHSLAKWVYSVPYVHRFSLFEMPLLGFAGYLPFGLECLVAGNFVREFLRKGKQQNPNDQ